MRLHLLEFAMLLAGALVVVGCGTTKPGERSASAATGDPRPIQVDDSRQMRTRSNCNPARKHLCTLGATTTHGRCVRELRHPLFVHLQSRIRVPLAYKSIRAVTIKGPQGRRILSHSTFHAPASLLALRTHHYIDRLCNDKACAGN